MVGINIHVFWVMSEWCSSKDQTLRAIYPPRNNDDGLINKGPMMHKASGFFHVNLDKFWTNSGVTADIRRLKAHVTSHIVRYEDTDGLAQGGSISIANAMEILQSCTKPSICYLPAQHISGRFLQWKENNKPVSYGRQLSSFVGNTCVPISSGVTASRNRPGVWTCLCAYLFFKWREICNTILKFYLRLTLDYKSQ